MATVYLAHDLRHDRRHILPLLDSGAVGGHPYYVMPLVDVLADYFDGEREPKTLEIMGRQR